MSSTSILSESQLNERLGRLLRQRKGPDAVMLGVLSVALFCGLVGFAVHFKWIVAGSWSVARMQSRAY